MRLAVLVGPVVPCFLHNHLVLWDPVDPCFPCNQNYHHSLKVLVDPVGHLDHPGYQCIRQVPVDLVRPRFHHNLLIPCCQLIQ